MEEVAAVMRNKICYCDGRRGCWHDKEERIQFLWDGTDAAVMRRRECCCVED